MSTKLGDYVKERRLEMSMSQKDFGDWVGVSYVTINAVENHHTCGLKTLRLIADKLEVLPQDLRAMMERESDEDNE